MAAATVSEIESQFAQLPPAIQLRLLERLVHHVRERLAPGQGDWEAGLSAMAEDPEIQTELGRSNSEFAATEGDGLGNHNH
jgi:hypothetical protein